MKELKRTYPDPDITTETEMYWNGTKAGKLMLKACKNCGRLHYYPRALCPHCLSDDTFWLKCTGRGTIYTYSVMRRTKMPYVIAYITLDEGITMLSNIVECDVETVFIGQAVEVVFLHTEGGHALPMFQPSSL